MYQLQGTAKTLLLTQTMHTLEFFLYDIIYLFESEIARERKREHELGRGGSRLLANQGD